MHNPSCCVMWPNPAVERDVSRGLSERHALRVVDMSASSLRYQPAPDRNGALREAYGGAVHAEVNAGPGELVALVYFDGPVAFVLDDGSVCSIVPMTLKRRSYNHAFRPGLDARLPGGDGIVAGGDCHAGNRT